MNCVNCGCRLTFFNETDELWSGTERSFCLSCREKITPFLEEPFGESHISHLVERKAALIAHGITAEGYAHLGEYCRYLDGLLAKPVIEAPRDRVEPDAKEEREEPIRQFESFRSTLREDKEGANGEPTDKQAQAMLSTQLRANHALRTDVRELGNEIREGTKLLADKSERMQEKIRLMSYLAATGAISGLLSFLAVLLLLIVK